METFEQMDTDHYSYYIYLLLTLLPVYLFFKLIQWFGWEVFINN